MDAGVWARMEAFGRRFERTQTVRVPHERLELFAKMEMQNPAGSAKDRSAYVILREAVRRGEICEDTTVVESSSGNFALSLSMLCDWLGIRFVPVLDENVNAATEARLRRLCARVEKIDATDATGGFLLNRLDRVEELLSEVDASYWPNQYGNEDGARAHYDLTGTELLASLPAIDYLFVGVGTGATIAGLSRRVKATRSTTRVVAVDVEGSAIFGSTPHRRFIPGIGSSIRPSMLDGALIDEIVIVSEWDEVRGCRELLHDHGIYAGGSSGGVYTAIGRYFEGYRGSPPVVAFLCADGGEPYAGTIYDESWVAAHFAEAMPTTVAAFGPGAPS